MNAHADRFLPAKLLWKPAMVHWPPVRILCGFAFSNLVKLKIISVRVGCES
jgi:hypothetical protein